MADLIIKNGKVVTPDGIISAGIAVDKGKIVIICKEDYLPSANKTIDARGKYVLPGMVDPHVHCGASGGPFDSQAKTESRAAVAGGVTTWGTFVFQAGKGFIEIFEERKRMHEENAICDAFFHNMISGQKCMDDIPRSPAIGVNSFKFNPGYKGPQLKLIGGFDCHDGVLLEGFETIAKLGRPAWAMVHAENADMMLVLREKIEKKEGRKDFKAWNDTRPRFVEVEAIKRCIEIARVTNCPLYIVHNTVGEAPEIINEARARGQAVVGETCPQYLTHTSEEPIQMFLDNPALGQVNPPLRDKWSIEKLWKGLADGIIETVGSDQVQHTLAQKGRDIWAAPMGLSNTIEMLLPVMLSEGVNKGRITMERLVDVCSANPARVFGIYPQKGAIAVGSDADFVLVDLQKKVKVTIDMLHSCADWNIYEGWNFTGWPVLTILRGQVVMENGKIVANPGIGKYVPCKCE